jgi:hypothetical protein
MKKIILFLCTGLSVILLSTSAMAYGIGGYFDFGFGSTVWEGKRHHTDTKDLIPTGGFVFDTSLGKNDVFNYRFKLGFGAMWADDSQLWKTGMVHTFGISPAALRTENFRFWFGPRIGLYYVGGTYYIQTPYYNVWYYNPYYYYDPYLMAVPYYYTVWMDLFRFDLGIVLAGLNFNIGPSSTLSFELGVNYGLMVGYNNRGYVKAGGWEISTTIAYIHRIGEFYQ